MALLGLMKLTHDRCVHPMLRLTVTLSPKVNYNTLCSTFRSRLCTPGHCSQARLVSTKSSSGAPEVIKGFEDLNKPIKFTTSKASEWSAESSFTGTVHKDTPEAQMYIITGSLAIFMIYFFFREENDLDEELGKSLWERIPGLEKQQLKVVYDYNVEHKIDNTAIEERMREIELNEQKEKLRQQQIIALALSKDKVT